MGEARFFREVNWIICRVSKGPFIHRLISGVCVKGSRIILLDV